MAGGAASIGAAVEAAGAASASIGGGSVAGWQAARAAAAAARTTRILMEYTPKQKAKVGVGFRDADGLPVGPQTPFEWMGDAFI
jgi:hypothetical protein